MNYNNQNNERNNNFQYDHHLYRSNAKMQQMVKSGSNSILFDENKAFMLGNLFESLYMTYNGFTNYPIMTHNRRQLLMLKIQIHEFNAHEANLYLDNHPNDEKMLEKFKVQNELARKAREEYETEFGPLSVASITDVSKGWTWIDGPWPWEKQK